MFSYFKLTTLPKSLDARFRTNMYNILMCYCAPSLKT